MRTFKEYREQPNFGCIADHDIDDWLIAPFDRHRDSGTLDRSNFECGVKALKEAEPDLGDDYRVMRFGHWAVGWVEIVIVRPGSKCAEVAAGIASGLEDYPVLDDDHFSNIEEEEYLDGWTQGGADEFRRELRKAFELSAPAAELLDSTGDEILMEFYESLLPSGEFFIAEGSGVYILVDHAVKDCTRSQLAAFLRNARQLQRATP
jgi:hypothetical protein